ncbi:MAG TPA: glycosyltransferase family 4 protein [Vicinamibacterales bacterium]|nr:glycosyltransferase family 4 protein [Vicinamibacterales bacterium]
MSRPSIALVSTYYAPLIGGAETAASQLAAFLASQQRRVVVITKRLAAEHARVERAGDVEIRRVGPVGPPRGFAKWIAAPAFFRALVRFRREYDVVVCVDYRGAGLAALWARIWTKRPVVFQAVTDGVISGGAVRAALSRARVPELLIDAMTWPIRRLYGGADAYCCISRTIEREAIAAGVPAARVHYLPNPVDLTVFRPASAEERAATRARLGVDAAAIVAIFAGRLSREKGLLELIEAWCAGMPTGSLLIVAGAEMPGHPWNVAAQARARAASAPTPVRFVGGQSQPDLAAWLRIADVHVQPSHFEAFGTSAIEAMASGLPVVASDIGGLPDFVKPDVNGVLVPPRDAPALADALRALLADAPRRARLARGAVETAQAFEIGRVLGAFAAIVDRTVTDHA